MRGACSLLLFMTARACTTSWPGGKEMAPSESAAPIMDVLLPREHELIAAGAEVTLPKEEEAAIDAGWDGDNCAPSTYGESGQHLGLDAFGLGEGSVFVDIGAGVGQAVLKAVLVHHATRGIGIEISASRHAFACKAYDKWASLPQALCGTECARRLQKPGTLEAIQASALDEEALAPLKEATHVFVYALCFPNALAKALEIALLERLPSKALVYTDPLFFDRIATPPSRHRWGQAEVNGRRFVKTEDGNFLKIAESYRTEM